MILPIFHVRRGHVWRYVALLIVGKGRRGGIFGPPDLDVGSVAWPQRPVVARLYRAALMLVSRLVSETWLRMSGRRLTVPSSFLGARCRRDHQLDQVVL